MYAHAHAVFADTRTYIIQECDATSLISRADKCLIQCCVLTRAAMQSWQATSVGLKDQDRLSLRMQGSSSALRCEAVVQTVCLGSKDMTLQSSMCWVQSM